MVSFAAAGVASQMSIEAAEAAAAAAAAGEGGEDARGLCEDHAVLPVCWLPVAGMQAQ